MADLNSGKGKFWGVDSNVKYADSFKGATKVAEKVKKGGTETKSDGYVVDAIDIDWGGLKLTTIDNGWSQKTVSSIEQNAGKGDNTQGIHSTAYLLNLISSSFTQIYNEIGGSDEAGLRKKIKDLRTAIDAMADLTPEELVNLKANIDAINKELADPGAAGTMVSILDTLVGFDKTKGSVKKYIDDRDKAILGSTADAATTYTVHGVRNYVDTTAKENLIGKDGDYWPIEQTLYGLAKYADNARETAINTADADATNKVNTLKSSLIGSQDDLITARTIWGAKNYAEERANSLYSSAKTYTDKVKDSVIGTSYDSINANTVWGVRNYAHTKVTDLSRELIGESTDQSTADSIWGAKNYAKEQVFEFAESLIGTSYDTAINTHWGIINTLRGTSADASTAPTIWGAKNYAQMQNTELRSELLGNIYSGTNDKNIWGTRYYAQDLADNARTNAVKYVVGNYGDKWDAQKTLYGVVEYVDTTAKENLIGASTDATTADTIWGAKNYAVKTLIGSTGDAVTADTIWGAKNYANITVKNSLIGNTADTTIKTHYGLKHILIGKSADASTADTIWGAKKHAVEQDNEVKNILRGASTDAATAHTIWGAKNYAVEKDGELENRLIGKSTDAATADTIWGAKKYAVKTLTGSTGDVATSETIYGVRKYTDEKIKTLSNTAFKVSRIEEGGEGILVFSTITSYAG